MNKVIQMIHACVIIMCFIFVMALVIMFPAFLAIRVIKMVFGT